MSQKLIIENIQFFIVFDLIIIVTQGQTKKNKTSAIKMLKALWIIASEDSIEFLVSELPEINCPILFLILLTINYFFKKIN